MADDNSHVSKTVDDIRRQVMTKIEEVRGLLVGLNAVEGMFGMPLTTIQDLVGAMANGGSAPAAQGQTFQASQAIRPLGPVTIRPDVFFAEEPMVAAKKYLAMVGHAVTFDEIADAVQRGGAAVSGANWREALEFSLMRSPFEVIKVADKTYGLASFYNEEQLKRLRAARRERRTGRSLKKKGAKGKSSRTKAVEAKKPSQPKGATPKKKTTASADEPAERPKVELSGDHVH